MRTYRLSLLLAAAAIAGSASAQSTGHLGVLDLTQLGFSPATKQYLYSDPSAVGNGPYQWFASQSPSAVGAPTNLITYCGSVNSFFTPGDHYVAYEFKVSDMTSADWASLIDPADTTHNGGGDVNNGPNVPMTYASFEHAAAVLQLLYPTGSYNGYANEYVSNATQQAVWNALYGDTSIAATDNTGIYWLDLYQVDSSGNVISQAQGQFVTPGPAPEPVTIALGIAGLGLAARRRFKKSS